MPYVENKRIGSSIEALALPLLANASTVIDSSLNVKNFVEIRGAMFLSPSPSRMA